MFSIAILIGVYSYLIFSLGLLGLLNQKLIFIFTTFFIFSALLFSRRKFLRFKFNLVKIPKIFLIILVVQALVNLAGALGPELGFDALWYHLTLPKLFLSLHKIVHIPGDLLYYSDMPKLAEMLYASSISIYSEIIAKLIHFSFGILTLVAIYKLARKFLDERFSILAVVIFYSNLVVGWQSTTAYIDLARTFFEVMAFWGFMNWMEIKTNTSAKRGWFIESAVMLGLAIATKLLSIGSLFIFLLLIIISYRKLDKTVIYNVFLYLCISLYVVMPWFLFSFLNTGNPIYPIFSDFVKGHFELGILNPVLILKSFWILFTKSSDPITPIYLIFLPLIFLFFNKLNSQMRSIVIYFFLSLVIWYFFPAKDSRYMLPALASLSVVIAYFIKNIHDKVIRDLALVIIIFVGFSSILYRGVANVRYLSVVFGSETKEHFLTNNLNFNYGDFYDTDGYFKKHINSSDKVLLYGFHNLYYVIFPFVDSSYVKKGDEFNYIAVQAGVLPDRFKFWKLIYSNPKTHVKLYSFGGQKWIY